MMNAGHNSAARAPTELIIAIRNRDTLALAKALEDGAVQDVDVDDAGCLLVACLSGRDPQHEIVNVRGKGQRFAKFPFGTSQIKDQLSTETIDALATGLRNGTIDIRRAKKTKGRPIVFWTKAQSDGSLIEDLSVEWAAANLEIVGSDIVVRSGAWNAGIDAFIAYSQRYGAVTNRDSPSQVDKKLTRYEDLRRYGKRALAAWRKVKNSQSNRD